MLQVLRNTTAQLLLRATFQVLPWVLRLFDPTSVLPTGHSERGYYFSSSFHAFHIAKALHLLLFSQDIYPVGNFFSWATPWDWSFVNLYPQPWLVCVGTSPSMNGRSFPRNVWPPASLLRELTTSTSAPPLLLTALSLKCLQDCSSQQSPLISGLIRKPRYPVELADVLPGPPTCRPAFVFSQLLSAVQTLIVY